MMREEVEQFVTRLRADDLVKVGTSGASEVRFNSSYTRDLAELKRALSGIESFGPRVAEERVQRTILRTPVLRTSP